VTITITGLDNVLPAAADDGFSTDQNTALTTGNVLANDSDPDITDTLSLTGFDTTNTLGLVTSNGDGTFDYDPNGQFEDLAAGQSATDTFTYTISDGNGGTDTATVTITITGCSEGSTLCLLPNENFDGQDNSDDQDNYSYLDGDFDPAQAYKNSLGFGKQLLADLFGEYDPGTLDQGTSGGKTHFFQDLPGQDHPGGHESDAASGFQVHEPPHDNEPLDNEPSDNDPSDNEPSDNEPSDNDSPDEAAPDEASPATEGTQDSAGSGKPDHDAAETKDPGSTDTVSQGFNAQLKTEASRFEQEKMQFLNQLNPERITA
jgi:VCBS repeat-containing protein